ncbi:MAG TPA: cytochrome C biogenesis protein [Allosphingosinicella sp.]|nr:cytochrome C biogenesis protein [Allosphingosinicella sp.]
MGWIILLVLALLVVAGLWRFARLDAGPLQFLLAALLLAGAGYAWHGRPSLDGSPRASAAQARVPANAFAEVRGGLFGKFDSADRWLTIAEGYQRRGDTRGGAAIIRSGLRAHPNNAALWTGYGNALVLHGGGTIAPAADLAFRRAERLAPKHPAPRLIYGLALAAGGRFTEAERAWKEALALSAPGARYRPGLEQQLAAIAEARAAGRIP